MLSPTLICKFFSLQNLKILLVVSKTKRDNPNRALAHNSLMTDLDFKSSPSTTIDKKPYLVVKF